MNLHLQHVEDLVLLDGLKGAKRTVDFLWKVMIQQIPLYTKYDGSPSFIIGNDDEGFFVSTKSFFNKKPVRYRTIDEIMQSRRAPVLKDKLFEIYHDFQDAKFEGVIQGDLLFTRETVFPKDGYQCFHPNTLIYGIPKEFWGTGWSIGVALHTSYDRNLNPTFGPPQIETPTRIFNANIEANILSLPYDFGPLLEAYNNISMNDHWHILDVGLDLQKKMNGIIRSGARDIDWTKHFVDDELKRVVRFIQEATVLKHALINNTTSKMNLKTWVRNGDIWHDTQQEGYVAVDGGDAVKLVNRENFSSFNFSPAISKGWDEPTRK